MGLMSSADIIKFVAERNRFLPSNTQNELLSQNELIKMRADLRCGLQHTADRDPTIPIESVDCIVCLASPVILHIERSVRGLGSCVP